MEQRQIRQRPLEKDTIFGRHRLAKKKRGSDVEGSENENKHLRLLAFRQRMQAACNKREEICEARQPSPHEKQAARAARRARRRPVPGSDGAVYLNSDDDPRNSSSEEDFSLALASISEESPSWQEALASISPVAVPFKAPPPGLPGTTMPPPSKAPPSRAISRGSLPAFKAPPPGSGPAWFWGSHQPVNLDH